MGFFFPFFVVGKYGLNYPGRLPGFFFCKLKTAFTRVFGGVVLPYGESVMGWC